MKMTMDEAVAEAEKHGYPFRKWAKGRCWYCHTRIFRICPGKYHPQKYTRDHVIPRSQGGKGLTVKACERCNSVKGSLSLPEFVTKAKYLAPGQIEKILRLYKFQVV